MQPQRSSDPSSCLESQGSVGGGGGVYTTQNSAEPAGEGRGAGPLSASDKCVTSAAWTPVPSPTHPSAVVGGQSGQLGVLAGQRAGEGRLVPEALERPKRAPYSLHIFYASSQAPCTLLHKALLVLMFCALCRVKDARNFPTLSLGWGEESSAQIHVRVLSRPRSTWSITRCLALTCWCSLLSSRDPQRVNVPGAWPRKIPVPAQAQDSCWPNSPGTLGWRGGGGAHHPPAWDS